ncbi:MAG: HD domain-containing protein [Candidatus Nomurabacteria bacterium]|jgi:5'-deoxynucleotidase YfbR-like HD superfamily hydrolase|nr:HD domain-containing protein [Candidatus Nomurabacteria bacterium]
MDEKGYEQDKPLELMLDDIRKIGTETVRLAGIYRAPLIKPDHQPARQENDAEHSLALSASVIYLAHEYYPELDRGLLADYAFVHDLVEVKVGDTPSLRLTDKDREEKTQKEHLALQEIINSGELPKYFVEKLLEYEDEATRESRFVRAVDKLLPSNVDILMVKNGYGSQIIDRLKDVFKIQDHQEFAKAHKEYLENFENHFGEEFPELVECLRKQQSLLNSEIEYKETGAHQINFEDLSMNWSKT